MTTAALAMVLLAAVLHALWNLAAKTSRGDATVFVWMYFTLAAILCVPIGLVQLVLAGASVTWALAVGPAVSAVFHIAYSMLLQTGYAKADLGVVYPIARGTGPLLSVAIAVLVLGEQPGPMALVGGLAIIAGILIVTGKDLLQRSPRLLTGLGYGTATGVAIAGYTLWDDFAVNALAILPIVHFGLSALFQSVLMLPWVLRRRAMLRPTWTADKKAIMVVAVLSPLAYILVLYALTTTSVALVAPVREASIVIGALLGWALFREPDPVRRVLGAAVVAGGIALIAAG